jgi:hypothetical protein
MSKWLVVAVLAMLVLASAVGLKGITVASTTAPVPPAPWASTTAPVPPAPWASTTAPVPPAPWN